MRPLSPAALGLCVSLAVLPLVAAQGKPAPRPRPAPASPPVAAKPPAPPPPRVEKPVPFKVGESLAYDITWSSLTAGTATLTVVDKQAAAGSAFYHVAAEGKPAQLVASLYPVYYKLDTLLDAFTLLPSTSTVYSQEGRRRRTRIVSFNQASRSADIEIKTATDVRHTVAVPPSTLDSVAALYAMRALPLREGLKTTMAVADGDDIYEVVVTVGRRETVSTGLGDLPAWRVTPAIVRGPETMRGRSLVLWIGDDPRRLPLRMEADMPVGQFIVGLRSAQG